MKISKILIRNFRNFRHLEVALDDHAVFVGPNDIGKSNLLHALRLVLDPALPDTARQLRSDDFWDGLPRPLTPTDRIEISVELTDFEEDDDQLAVLAEFLVSGDPMVARLTFVGLPPATTTESVPDFFLFGGDQEERRFGYELRRRLPLDLLHALRDVESDLASWRRSPLRPLIAAAWDSVPAADKIDMADGVDAAASTLTGTPSISEVESAIQKSLARTTGSSSAADVRLGVTPTDPESLIRILRLLVDGGRRTVADAGLGSSNVLYVTLKLLEIERLVRAHERDHTFVAIEEPEAHLHPHLQRQVYRDFLRLRPHLSSGENPLESLPATILLTTHSPHIASISPLRSIILLRADAETLPSGAVQRSTIACSAASLELKKSEREDLERYLEASRAEILFSRAVVLVEGDSELYLVPRLAELCGVRCDQVGITVASIAGTHFESYALLLRGLGIPFAVVTDGDPQKARSGVHRTRRLLGRLGIDVDEEASDDTIRATAAEEGIFIGDSTFEIDLCEAGAESLVLDVLAKIGTTKTARERAEAWRFEDIDPGQLLADVEAIGKGRFAQRLASTLGDPGDIVPAYIRDAITFVAGKIS